MAVALMVCLPLAARAQEPPTDTLARLRALEQRLDQLAAENAALRAQAADAAAAARPAPSHLTVADGVHLRLTGYADLGYFGTTGDGVAYVRDAGKLVHPEYANYPWVFLGDPWSNPINSQGDSADLGLDRTNLPRFDPIHSRGKPSFLVNMLNVGMLASMGDRLLFESSIGFEPRQGTLGSPGDSFDVDLTYLEWKPSDRLDLHLYAGKFESVFGIEYRNRKAPDRFGITPSIISRYTVGTPTGLKVRGSLGDGLFTYAFAVTNGGTSTEKFGHFYNEIDTNFWKTVSGRLSLARSFGREVPVTVEIGASGLVGAQDLQPSDDILQWQVGGDLKLLAGDFAFRGEYLRAHADGGGVTNAPFLRAQGGYGELTYQLLPWAGALVRVDFRDAVLYADTNLYVTQTLRETVALRFDICWNVLAKLEYVHVGELEGPEIPDDVMTSSLIFRY